MLRLKCSFPCKGPEKLEERVDVADHGENFDEEEGRVDTEPPLNRGCEANSDRYMMSAACHSFDGTEDAWERLRAKQCMYASLEARKSRLCASLKANFWFLCATEKAEEEQTKEILNMVTGPFCKGFNKVEGVAGDLTFEGDEKA